MKKTRLLIILFMFASALFIESSVNANETVEVPEIPGEVFTTFTCRCKYSGCFGGNNISLRAACAKNVGDCTQYKNNCP